MTTRRGLYSNPDGSLAVIIPAPAFVKQVMEKNNCTEDEAVAAILDKDSPGGITPELVDAADIPVDRTFRNAWEHDTTPAPEKVRTNISKAQTIAHEMRRAARDAEMAPLDPLASIPGAQGAAAEAQRATIRTKYADMQAAIDAAKDEAGLKAALGI